MNRKLVEGEDFYYEGPYLVFTEKFLRERGYCCESGCRHCPYGYRRDRRVDVPVADETSDE
ncbi:MAG TPA: DUF5522 domain-containing protein [Thermoanaerobaculia bacterium]|jgi:hypothetical protein|nr:DUF5522 domain-containing protein [Thermoanaerobaculia bacterium]